MTEFAPRTFDEMIAAGRFDIVRPAVNQIAFPLDPEKFDDRFLQVFGFTGPVDIQKAVAQLTECGLRQALPEQLLAYIAGNPDAHKSYSLVALGTTGQNRRLPPCVMRLGHHAEKRILETRPFVGLLETDERILISHPD